MTSKALRGTALRLRFPSLPQRLRPRRDEGRGCGAAAAAAAERRHGAGAADGGAHVERPWWEN